MFFWVVVSVLVEVVSVLVDGGQCSGGQWSVFWWAVDIVLVGGGQCFGGR